MNSQQVELVAFEKLFEHIYKVSLSTFLVHFQNPNILTKIIDYDFLTESTDKGNYFYAEILLPICFVVGYFLSPS